MSERRGKKKLEEKAVKEAIGAWRKGEVVEHTPASDLKAKDHW